MGSSNSKQVTAPESQKVRSATATKQQLEANQKYKVEKKRCNEQRISAATYIFCGWCRTETLRNKSGMCCYHNWH